MNDLISKKSVETVIHNYFIGLIEMGIYQVDVVDCNADICKAIEDIVTVNCLGNVAEQIVDYK